MNRLFNAIYFLICSCLHEVILSLFLIAAVIFIEI